MADTKYAALFVCSGNSARSLFAEAILRKLGGDAFDVYSAGTNPHGSPNPHALALMQQKGHDVSQLRSKDIAEFTSEGAPKFDFIFTVCDQAANEECPAFPGQPITAHWGMKDPVKVEGEEAEKSLAFQEAYGILFNRLSLFTALSIDALDGMSLQKAVDKIATQA